MEAINEGYPEHIAIIPDGNRRWARARNMPASFGHKEGVEKVKKIIKYANKIGIKYLTIYLFSTENWKRSKEEVDALWTLYQNYMEYIVNNANSENIRIKVFGDISVLSEKMQKSTIEAINKTKDNTGLTFSLCLNYGGRQDIIQAIKKIYKQVEDNKIKIEDINEELVSNNLYTAGVPHPDLLIRTSNELRISNFLLWQIAYTELYFVEKNWPDFDETDIDDAINEYKKRNRRFGGK